MIFQEKHGREMDQLTKEEWGREASISSNRINVLWSEWAEKRTESTHYGQTGSSGSDTAGHTTRDQSAVLV
jgi:hypothetical protein